MASGPLTADGLDAVPGVAGELALLARSTEGEFLVIGEKLQHFYERAAEISKISQAVAHLMSGNEVATVIEGFREIISSIKRLEGASEQGVEALQRVLENLVELQRQLSGFHKTVRNLRVLCVFIRIESARLGDKETGFNDLADEVGKLALEIEERCAHLSARSESLSQLIGQALIRVQNLETSQRVQASVILDKTMASLESITEKHGLSSAGANQISARYDAISRSIGEIVASMQFHDITRQRMEHAKEALESITGDQQTGGGTGPQETGESAEDKGKSPIEDGWRLIFGGNGRRRHVEESGQLLRLAGNICELQMAQLSRARDDLVSAVGCITDNLRRVADLVAEMARETQEMAGTADESGRSSLAEVEAGFSSVMAALSTYADANRELSLMMSSVGQTLGDMSAYTGDIERIGAKIKVIALNAILKASHIGEEGASLGLLAETIHRLSAETYQQTETISEALRSISSTSASLCTGIGADGEGNRAEVTRVDATLMSLLHTLKNVNQDIVTLLTRMNEEGRALSDQILRTIEGVSVHDRVNEVISRVVSQLGEAVALSGLQSVTESQADKEERIRALATSYTMQGEREVHQSMLVAGEASEQPHVDPESLSAVRETRADQPDGKSDEETEADLGDNVELF